jgi:hypothetical protein
MDHSKIGPRLSLTCKGCPAYTLTRWDDYGENDYHDCGTATTCAVTKRQIQGNHTSDKTPEWCPHFEYPVC